MKQTVWMHAMKFGQHKTRLFALIALFFSTQWLAAVASLAADATVTPVIDGKYRALVIGNNDYRDSAGIWRTLKTAGQDAETIADILKNDYGFADVTLLRNASRAELLHGLQQLSNRVERNDSVLIFYSGHCHLENEGQRGYWIPVDADGRDSASFIRHTTIRDEVDVLADHARHTLLLADSCFSRALLRPTSTQMNERDYTRAANRKSVQIFTAGGMEFVDHDYKDSGHSPFSYYLINELRRNQNNMITLTELAESISKTLSRNNQQQPQLGILYRSNDDSGEFMFARANISGDELTTPNTVRDDPSIEINKNRDSGVHVQAPSVVPRSLTDRVFLPLPRL